MARSEYVAFLDADDSWLPHKVERQLSLMLAHSEFSVTGHLAHYPGQKGGYPVVRANGVHTYREISRTSVSLKNPMVTPSFMAKRGIAQRFPEGSRYKEDHRFLQEIVFSGSDDEFADPGALAALAQAAARANVARIAYGRISLVTVKGTVAETVGKPWPEARKDLCDGFMLPQPATLHHRSLFQELGSFDRSYRIAGDYEFLLRELIARNALFVDRVVANVRLGGVSSRAQSIHQALCEVSRARRAHGLGRPGLRLRVALVSSWVAVRLHSLVGDHAFNFVADCYRVLRGKPRVWSV